MCVWKTRITEGTGRKMGIHLLFALGLLIIDRVQCADLETHCTLYTDGVQSTANAIVDGNSVDGTLCTPGSLTAIRFRFTERATNNLVLTEGAPYDPTSGTCNTAWSGNARCVSRDPSTNKYTYQVRFVANKTEHSQQYLTVATNCAPTSGPLSPYSVNYSSCDPIPVQAQPPTSDGLTASQKAGIAVGCCLGVCGVLSLILTLVKCKGEELVGLDDEQIKRIDHYVQLLQANTSALRKIEKKRGFGCCDMPTKLRVDGFHSLNEAGELRDVQKQLRIAISIRLFFLCRRSMETVKQEVRDFLRENVTPFKVRIVKDPANIDRQKLESIAAKTETKILPPAENRKGEMVIQIEGRDDRAVDDAKKEVMKLIQSSGSANGGDGP